MEDEDLEPMRQLWLGVISQAVEDAMGAGPKEMSEARQWLLFGGPDFAAVCEFARVDAKAVRDKAREMIFRTGRAA